MGRRLNTNPISEVRPGANCRHWCGRRDTDGFTNRLGRYRDSCASRELHQRSDDAAGRRHVFRKDQEWSELGGPETRILLIDRLRTQNIRETFESHLGITGKIPGTAKAIGPDDTVIKTLVGTLPPLSAVAYVSLSTGLSAVSNGVAVRLLPVDKIEPEVPTVRDGRYGLRRPLLLLSKREANPLVESFLTFALSPPGQAIVGELYVAMSNK